MTCYFYRPQRSCVKVIFSEACVKNSVRGGGGCWPQYMLEYTTPTPWAATLLGRHPWEDTHRADTPGQTPAPSRCLLQRMVRIVLECILVISFISRDVCLKQQTCALKWCTVNAIGWVALIVKTVLHYNA